MATEEVSRPIYNPPTSRYLTPLARIDWICRWIAYLASILAIFKVLEYAGKLTVLVALCSWFADWPERREASIRTAWSVVNAKGGGRKESLKYLSDHHVDLKGLYGAGGYFSGIELKEKDDLSWSDLADANFEKATLASVKLIGAHVSNANFANANLKGANFTSAHFEPIPPHFHHADIDDAHFEGVTGLNYLGYHAISQATNWRKAHFGAGIAGLIECAELGNQAPQKCQVGVPEILSRGDAADSQLFVQALLQNISCELRDAVNYVVDINKQIGNMKTFIDTWGVQTTLTLSIGAQGAAAEATRIDKLSSYHLVSELKKIGVCPSPARPSNGDLLLQGDLKLREWLLFAITSAPIEAVAPGVTPAHETSLQHEVKFVVVAEEGASPQYRLKATDIDSAKAPANSSANGPRTYDLLITFSPAQWPTKISPR